MKRTLALLALTILLLANSAAAQPLPSDSAIRKVLSERLGAEPHGVAIVVGIIEPAGRRIVSYGAKEIDARAIYEIGSVTKVFTSLLLAEAVRRGEVKLDDPIAKYLPPGVKVPARTGSITLEDLATHTSGLPRLPSNLAPSNMSNPYADYTTAQLYQFLSTYELTRDPGKQYEYSNLGAGLLGQLLARRAGTDYETLVRTRVLEPLGMKSTSITLSDVQKKRLAAGHDEKRAVVPNWDLPTFAGAGALRSDAGDLLTLLSAYLGYTKTPLAAAMTSQLAVRRPTGTPNLDIALGWHILRGDDGRELVWHNGGTGGYHSFIAYDAKRRTGVVVLTNANPSIDDIGQQLFAPPAKARTEVAANPKLFDGYVGDYQLGPGFVLSITRDGDHLFAQATGQPRFELFAQSDNEFFLKVVDAQITFEKDALVLHQNGANIRANRIPKP
jgi:D-alanyl-D-alanine-carboxypeptidase/D-alanyl-D-alanine-endopeptidase